MNGFFHFREIPAEMTGFLPIFNYQNEINYENIKQTLAGAATHVLHQRSGSCPGQGQKG